MIGTAILGLRALPGTTKIALKFLFGFGQFALSSLSARKDICKAVALFAFIVLPLILVGKGLALTSPYTVGVVSAFGPKVLYVLEWSVGKSPVSPWLLFASLVYGLAIIMTVVLRLFSLKRMRNEEPLG